MNNKAIGIFAITALAVVAGGAYASTRENPAETSDTPPDNFDPFNVFNERASTVNWKVNEYPKYATAIREAEKRWNIPQDLYARQLYQESRFRADTISGAKRSPMGAVGIAQFEPPAAKDYGLIANGQDLRTDPFASIEAGAHYMHDLYGMFGNWESALMAYNWGPGNVLKYNRGEHVTVPIETSTYVAQITADVPLA
jgi:soluble lytic murein transglycosylase-like protein